MRPAVFRRYLKMSEAFFKSKVTRARHFVGFPLFRSTRQVEAVYRTMDENADGRLTRSEAQRFFRRFGQISSLASLPELVPFFWGGAFLGFCFVFHSPGQKLEFFAGVLPAKAMFSEVDEDGDGEILLSEWRRFWEQVKENGYSEADLAEELQLLKEGGWVDFLDDRNVSVNSRSGAKLAQ